MELKIVAFDITNLNKNLDLSKIDKDYINCYISCNQNF